MKRKTKRVKQPIVSAVMGIAFVVSLYMLYFVVLEVLATVEMRQQTREAHAKLAEVLAENEQLLEQKDKLNDPDYVKHYARSGYMLTKEGEQIFYLPKKD